MILVDTSVWVDHLRRGNAELSRLLVDQQVASALLTRASLWTMDGKLAHLGGVRRARHSGLLAARSAAAAEVRRREQLPLAKLVAACRHTTAVVVFVDRGPYHAAAVIDHGKIVGVHHISASPYVQGKIAHRSACSPAHVLAARTATP